MVLNSPLIEVDERPDRELVCQPTRKENLRLNPPVPFESMLVGGRRQQPTSAGMFEQQFIQQLLLAAKPQIKALIREVIADEGDKALIVDYEEAGRMIGTSYEGVRKLVRKGRLKAVSRSGRHRGIAVEELRDYVHRSVIPA